MKKWIFVISAIIIIAGILYFIFNIEEEDLGDNYYYLPKYEAMDIGYAGGGIIYKSPQKNLFDEVKVHGNVVETSADKDFIIAIQNTDTSYPETTMQNASIYSKYYFIIEKKSDKVHGPFKRDLYLIKREELGIPKNLKLNE